MKSNGNFHLDQFYVLVRRPGIIALQNAKNTNSFLCIKKGVASSNVSVLLCPHKSYCLIHN